MAEAKKKETLQQTLGRLSKTTGVRVGGLNDIIEPVDAITTGNLAIDSIIGVGGLPKGRLIELYGPPSSGKTTLGLHAAVECQRAGGTVAYFDFEHAMDTKYAAALGLDIDKVLFAQPDFFEQGETLALGLIETGQVDMIIFDSVAAMTPEKLFTAEAGKGQIALQARLMAQMCIKLTVACSRTGCVAVFLNHIAEVIDISPMGQKMAGQGIKRVTTPGGRALKFYASVRLEFKQIGGVKETVHDALKNEDVQALVGTKTKVSVVKNKVAAPFGVAEVLVRYGQGFSQPYTVLQVLVAHKVLKKDTGGIFRLPPEYVQSAPSLEVTGKDDKGNFYIRGEANMLNQMEKCKPFADALTAKAREILASQSLVVPVERLVLDLADPDELNDDPPEEIAALLPS